MRYTIDPGKERRSINFVSDVCFSHVTDLEGKPLDLYMSLMLQNGNSEMRLADGKDDEVSTGRQPAIVWINGAGWRGCDRHLMAAEMTFLAEAGYAMAFIDYRNSAQGKFPDQLIDCKTAVRFLRAHAGEYGIDPDHIGTIGRSAGGHLSAWMAMNTDGYDSQEWSGYSSTVQAAVDMFGPVDVRRLNEIEVEKIKNDPNPRWSTLIETHGGALVGGDEATIIERSDAASPIFSMSDRMCPITILHGDKDPAVPLFVSEEFYDRIVKAGFEDRADLYVVKNGGHGTRELFQAETKGVIREFFDRNLKK